MTPSVLSALLSRLGFDYDTLDALNTLLCGFYYVRISLNVHVLTTTDLPGGVAAALLTYPDGQVWILIDLSRDGAAQAREMLRQYLAGVAELPPPAADRPAELRLQGGPAVPGPRRLTALGG